MSISVPKGIEEDSADPCVKRPGSVVELGLGENAGAGFLQQLGRLGLVVGQLPGEAVQLADFLWRPQIRERLPDDGFAAAGLPLCRDGRGVHRASCRLIRPKRA